MVAAGTAVVGAGAGCVAAAVRELPAAVVGRVAAWLRCLAVPVIDMYVYYLQWDVSESVPPTESQPRQR